MSKWMQNKTLIFKKWNPFFPVFFFFLFFPWADYHLLASGHTQPTHCLPSSGVKPGEQITPHATLKGFVVVSCLYIGSCICRGFSLTIIRYSEWRLIALGTAAANLLSEENKVGKRKSSKQDVLAKVQWQQRPDSETLQLPSNLWLAHLPGILPQSKVEQRGQGAVPCSSGRVLVQVIRSCISLQ